MANTHVELGYWRRDEYEDHSPTPARADDSTDNAPATARFSLSATQVIASALAATTATFAASYLGVAGTVIGAAVASVLTVVGNAVYSHSIRRTGERVRVAVPIAARWTPRDASARRRPAAAARARPRARGVADDGRRVRRRLRRRPARVTGVELVAGRPLTDVVRGTTGSGTTLFGDAVQQTTSAQTPTPTTTVTVTPSVVVVTPDGRR